MKDFRFGDLSPAQLLDLKSQYLTSIEMIDREEADLKSRLSELASARVKVQELMLKLDLNLERPARPEAGESSVRVPAKPRARRVPNPAARERSPG